MRLRYAIRVALLAGFLLGALAPASPAQIVIDFREEINFDRPEAWAMKYFASVNALTGLGAPRDLPKGHVELAFETGTIPTLSEVERTVGFDGTKTEDLNRGSVFARPRLLLGLPRKLSLDLGWVPPVERNGVEANLFSIAVGRPLFETRKVRMGLRGFAQIGTIEGDLTCSAAQAAAGNDLALNPFGCNAASNDEQEMNVLGLELSWAFKPGNGSRWEPHLGLIASHMDLEFEVDASYENFEDHSVLTTDGVTVAVVGGATFQASDRLRIGGEIFYSPLDVVRPPSTSSANDGLVNVRALVTYRVRAGDR